MKVDFVYSEVSDLLFHFFAHMKVQNASDLYSEIYMHSMQLEKNGDTGLLQEATSLASYYNDNFERLGVINFLPFYCSDLQSLQELLLHYESFGDEDKELFLSPLLRVLEQENKFYSDYWKRIFQNNQEERLLVEAYIQNELQKYNCLFRYFKKESAVVSLSFSLTCNGRGMGSEKSFAAIVPFPKDRSEYRNCFFQLLHEYTHQFTDSLLGSNINMDDGSHELSENLVVLFDYYFIKTFDKTDIEAYFTWLVQNTGMTSATISEPEFLSLFKIPEPLNESLLSLVRDVIRI